MSEERKKISLAPGTGSIAAWANAPFKWAVALGELIDNSFDAGATRVEIQFGPIHSKTDRPAYMEITDDGNGVKNMDNIFKLGHSEPSAGAARLGRYGVGLKEAVLLIGDKCSTFVVSRRRGKNEEQTLHVDWNEVWRSGSWDIDGAITTPTMDTRPGTMIRIQPVVRPFPKKDDLDRLLAELGYLYCPALKGGKQIVIRKHGERAKPSIARYERPPFDGEEIDVAITVDGKSARVRAGIVKDGADNPKSGITYYHEFRVIKPASRFGCKEHDYTRILGFVELDGQWPLTKNKDDLAGDQAALYEEVYRVIRPLLLRADELGKHDAEQKMEHALTQGARAMIRGGDGEPAKAVREVGPRNADNDGSKATGGGTGHKRAKRTQPGNRFRAGALGNLTVKFGPLGKDGGIGEVKEGDPMGIVLNTYELDKTQHLANLDALFAKVAALLAEWIIARPGQKSLGGILGEENFSQCVARFLRNVSTPALASVPLAAVK